MTHQVAGYKIYLRKRLGRGAFGTVYRATKEDEDKEVAAKEIDKDRNSRGAIREIKNAHKQRQLIHDNIVRILHIHEDKEEIWMFFELCDGGDINHYAQEHFKEFTEIHLTIMRDIVCGLHFLHELRIAHRDIKPENVLIKTENDVSKIKLTDFGVSKFHSQDAPTSAMHTNLGTHTYKAPEFWDINQEDGSITYYKNVDVYAMALTFLAILQAR